MKRLDDRKVYEYLQGHWIVEMSEMNVVANAKSIEETNLFKSKNQEFKSKKFTEEMKYYYTDFINELVKDPAEKLKVFDKNSDYLPTRKIGRNNPKAEEIRIDNYLRQEWNHMVDWTVTEGVTEEELRQVKKKEIIVSAQESIIKEG